MVRRQKGYEEEMIDVDAGRVEPGIGGELVECGQFHRLVDFLRLESALGDSRRGLGTS